MLDTNQDIHPSFTQRLDTRTQVHMHPWLLYLLHMLTLRTNSNLTVQKHLLIPREIRITTVLFCAISALCKVWERTVEKQRELRPWWPPPIRPADHKCKRSIARHKTGETSSQLDMSAVKLQWHLINNTKLRQVVLSSFNFITNNNNFCFHQRHAYLVSRDNRHIVIRTQLTYLEPSAMFLGFFYIWSEKRRGRLETCIVHNPLRMRKQRRPRVVVNCLENPRSLSAGASQTCKPM